MKIQDRQMEKCHGNLLTGKLISQSVDRRSVNSVIRDQEIGGADKECTVVFLCGLASLREIQKK
jgi:hypothetical protein